MPPTNKTVFRGRQRSLLATFSTPDRDCRCGSRNSTSLLARATSVLLSANPGRSALANASSPIYRCESQRAALNEPWCSPLISPCSSPTISWLPAPEVTRTTDQAEAHQEYLPGGGFGHGYGSEESGGLAIDAVGEVESIWATIVATRPEAN